MHECNRPHEQPIVDERKANFPAFAPTEAQEFGALSR